MRRPPPSNQAQQPIPRVVELATFPCHVCKQPKRPAQIKVRRLDISPYFQAPENMVVMNINYCSDNESCAEIAQNTQQMIDKYIVLPKQGSIVNERTATPRDGH